MDCQKRAAGQPSLSSTKRSTKHTTNARDMLGSAVPVVLLVALLVALAPSSGSAARPEEKSALAALVAADQRRALQQATQATLPPEVQHTAAPRSHTSRGQKAGTPPSRAHKLLLCCALHTRACVCRTALSPMGGARSPTPRRTGWTATATAPCACPWKASKRQRSHKEELVVSIRIWQVAPASLPRTHACRDWACVDTAGNRSLILSSQLCAISAQPDVSSCPAAFGARYSGRAAPHSSSNGALRSLTAVSRTPARTQRRAPASTASAARTRRSRSTSTATVGVSLGLVAGGDWCRAATPPPASNQMGTPATTCPGARRKQWGVSVWWCR